MLVDTSEGIVTKVYDFGNIMRQINDPEFDMSAELDWRHASSELLSTKQASTKSDVWSFSITAWEIFAFGGTPFYETGDYAALAKDLVMGKRPNQLDGLPDELFKIMVQCWNIAPAQRPVGSVIV